MITTAAYIEWIKLQIPALTVYSKPASPLPDKPDRLVMITRTSGPGEIMDGLFDRVGFSVRVRGSAHDPSSAEEDAYLLDDAVRRANIPAMIGDSWVTSVIRFGGLGPMPGTPDLGHRSEWVATHIVTASTNL